MPRQLQAIRQTSLISQIDLDIVRVAATTGDIGAGDLVDVLQPRGALGQGDQFLFKFCRISGIRVGLGCEYLYAHVVEQLRPGIGAIDRGDSHGVELFPQCSVDVDGIEHARHALHQLPAGFTADEIIGRVFRFVHHGQESMGLWVVGQFKPVSRPVHSPAGHIGPVVRVGGLDDYVYRTGGCIRGLRQQIH
ncbi:hypothetical protein D3C86_892170 [compost metagenome]